MDTKGKLELVLTVRDRMQKEIEKVLGEDCRVVEVNVSFHDAKRVMREAVKELGWKEKEHTGTIWWNSPACHGNVVVFSDKGGRNWNE